MRRKDKKNIYALTESRSSPFAALPSREQHHCENNASPMKKPMNTEAEDSNAEDRYQIVGADDSTLFCGKGAEHQRTPRSETRLQYLNKRAELFQEHNKAFKNYQCKCCSSQAYHSKCLEKTGDSRSISVSPFITQYVSSSIITNINNHHIVIIANQGNRENKFKRK